MKKTTHDHLIHSFVFGAIIAVIFIAVITIASELFHPIKDWLKEIFYHHWIGKGVLAAAIFAASALTRFFQEENIDGQMLGHNIFILFWIVIAASSSIFSFYIYELFAHM